MPVPVPASGFSTEIKDEKGTTVATIKQSNDTIEINLGTQKLRGTSRDSGKRKYTLDNGPVILEVKPHEAGFKVRNPDGTLRWKVKIADDKIKISDNEQNDHPFELKSKGGGRFKVVAPNDRELGNVRGSEVEDASGAVQFRTNGAASAAYGVLLIKEIPAMQQYVIIAELLARRR